MPEQVTADQYMLALSYALNGQYENALSLLDELRAASPDNVDVQFLRALCAKSAGRPGDAGEIRARPSVFHRALSVAIAGKHHEALAILDPLYAEHPADLWVCYLRAHCLAMDKRVGESRALAQALHQGYGIGPWTRIVAEIDRKKKRRKLAMIAAGVLAAYAVFLLALWATAPARPERKPRTAHVGAARPAVKNVPAPPQTPEQESTSDPTELLLAAAENASQSVRVTPDAPLETLLNALPSNEAAAYLLTRLTAKDLPLLRTAFDAAKGEWSQRQLVQLMGHIGDPACCQKLHNIVIVGKSEIVRAESACAIGQIADPASIDVLERVLRDDTSAMVRKTAAAALAKVGGAGVTDTLTRAYEKEKAPDVRVTLQWLLLGGAYERTVPPVLTPGQACSASYEGTFYHLYVPASYRREEPADVLVSVHGTDGTSDAYLNMWVEDAERYGVVVIAPYFDFPQYRWFGLLNIDIDAIRADRRLLEIIDQVKSVVNINARQIILFGHSQGGQFVTSFTCAHPHRVLRAAACGTRQCLYFSPAREFPSGLKPHPLAPDLAAVFAAFLQSDFAFVIGTGDERFGSCENMYKCITGYAERTGVPCNISFLPVPNGRHAGVENRPTASAFLFRDREPIAITRNRALNDQSGGVGHP